MTSNDIVAIHHAAKAFEKDTSAYSDIALAYEANTLCENKATTPQISSDLT